MKTVDQIARRIAIVASIAMVAGCSAEESATTPDSAADVGIDSETPDTADAAIDEGIDATTDVFDVQEPDTSPLPVSWDGYRPPEAPIPRLTALQLRNSLRDIFGENVVAPRINLPDLEEGGLFTVGASGATLAPRSVEDVERAAVEIGRQVVAPENRERFIRCEPSGAVDPECAAQVIGELGRRIWRRDLTDEEVTRITALATAASSELGDFYAGLSWAIPALIQSPNFLFRRELGTPNEDGTNTLTNFELASRLAYVLWNTTPDDVLLDAAAAGELTSDAGLRTQLDRMLADPRAERGLLDFFTDIYELDRLERLSKDPNVFPAMSPELGPAALEETERFLVDLVFTRNADFRELVTASHTFVDRRLAALYGIEAPMREGFARVELPDWTGRRGMLGQVGFLAANSHPTSTSATMRGIFVRETLLCTTIEPPPADVDTSIPVASSTARTLRERIAVHLEDELCAGCHAITDPIGLAFEVFDGIGYWRDSENDALIDPSGDLDGVAFNDAWELADVIAADPAFTRCIVQQFNRWGSGAVEALAQRNGLQALNAEFANSNYKLRDLIEIYVMSPAFRTVGAPSDIRAEGDEE